LVIRDIFVIAIQINAEFYYVMITRTKTAGLKSNWVHWPKLGQEYFHVWLAQTKQFYT